MTRTPNIDGVNRMLGNAKKVTRLRSSGGRSAPVTVHEIEIDEETQLPVGCPVVPLGILGMARFYLDAKRQMIELEAKEHSRLGLIGLFGRHTSLLYDYWPRHNKDGDVTGWRPELASERLMAAAARRPVWDPFKRVRGAGAWLGEAGELVLHCGDMIWIGPGPAMLAELEDQNSADAQRLKRGVWIEPGEHGRHVYPAAEALPRPAEEPALGGDTGPAAKLLTLLNTWAWRRGEADAMLLLGWIAAAMIGGALKWRPLTWITGGRSTGKSTLQDLLKLIFDEAIVYSSDTSAAGIWQELGYATLPVQVDELEAEEDNRKGNNVVKLARQASSGGVVLRGGADHHGSKFIARSCFLFSSILLPPLLGQDRSRMAILELGEIKSTQVPVLDPMELRTLGRQLRRRLADGWPRFAQTLEIYRHALQEHGHAARGADQFGTLLACADLLLHDHATDTDSADRLAEKLKASELAEHDDDERDEARCLAHIQTSVIDPFRNGGRRSVGEWIAKANQPPIERIKNSKGGDERDENDPQEANRVLGTYGLKVIGPKLPGGKSWLAVANYHQALAQLYEGTHWAGRSGTMGVWVQALRRLPGAERFKGSVWFAGVVCKSTVIPLELLLPNLV